MNAEFLQKIGINDEDPNVVFSKLGAKEVELLDKRDLAETNGYSDRVEEIDGLLEQLKREREVVKEEAKSYIPKKEETASSQDDKKIQYEKKNAAYEKLMQKKKAEAQAASEEVLTGAAKSGNQQTTVAQATASSAAQKKYSAPSQSTQPSGVKQQSAQLQATNTPTKSQVTAQVQQTPTSASTGNSEYSTGLRYYQKQDFANAFKCFVNVAEAKSVADQTAAQERTQASYLLAVMYKNGVGTNKDIDRSNHYLRRAADFGYDQAQLEYGCLILSQHMSSGKADMKARKEGWEYIEKAADSGLVDAIKKYIDLAKSSSDADKHIIAKAKGYIPLIKGKLDSYGAQKCDEWVDELNKTEKAAKKKASYPRKYIIGEILFLLGTIYLFKGLHPTFFDEELPQISRFIPDIPDYLIIKWSKLLDITKPYMTNQGIFGGWLIIIGNILRGLGIEHAAPKNAKTKCNTFGTVIRFVIIVLCVIHFVANIAETSDFLGNGSYIQFIAMIGCILLGRIFGWVMYKIIK